MKKIIILHGWAKNLDRWDNFIDSLKEKNIDVQIPKIPGLTVDLKEVWDLNDYVKWLKNILDREKEKIILIGHSNGGRIALSFADLFPKKIEKLILIDSAGIYHNELPQRVKRIVFKTLAKVGKRLTSSQTVKNILYKLARESDYNNADNNVKQTMINLISSDLKSILPHIQTPTLIIWGGEDKVTPLSDGVLMNSLIKNSKLEIIENARHSPMFTNPQEVAKIIYEHI